MKDNTGLQGKRLELDEANIDYELMKAKGGIPILKAELKRVNAQIDEISDGPRSAYRTLEVEALIEVRDELQRTINFVKKKGISKQQNTYRLF